MNVENVEEINEESYIRLNLKSLGGISPIIANSWVMMGATIDEDLLVAATILSFFGRLYFQCHFNKKKILEAYFCVIIVHTMYEIRSVYRTN